MKKYSKVISCFVLVLTMLIFTCACIPVNIDLNTQAPHTAPPESVTASAPDSPSADGFNPADIPEFSADPYFVVNGNIPYFNPDECTTVSYEYYGELDELGRCSSAIASIGRDLMPTEPRGNISSVKPSGWQSVKYDIVDGQSLYNRCHLIGFQLSGENANVRNLITGTRYMNVIGMLPFENMVADYVKETDNHVMYRVTPIFDGDDLVASGVLMEAYSVEDEGEGICFNVFCYNNQPGITIDYSDGSSRLNGETSGKTYILNRGSKKFHDPSCQYASSISDKNRDTFSGSRDELIAMGYTPCGNCKP